MAVRFEVWSDKLEYAEEIESTKKAYKDSSSDQSSSQASNQSSDQTPLVGSTSNEETADLRSLLSLNEFVQNEVLFDMDSFSKKSLRCKVIDDSIIVASYVDLSVFDDLKFVREPEKMSDKLHVYVSELPLTPLNVWVFNHVCRYFGDLKFRNDEDKDTLANVMDKDLFIRLEISENKRRVKCSAPNLPTFREFARKMNTYMNTSLDSNMGNWSSNSSTVFFYLGLLEFLPKMYQDLPIIDESVNEFIHEPILGFDGSIESLKDIPIDELHIIQANVLPWDKDKKKEKKSLSHRMKAVGIHNLEDLMFRLPRRYIDKTNPSNLDGLRAKEPATIMGTVRSASSFQDGLSAAFIIETNNGMVRVSFFHQSWLLRKFYPGDEVLVSGTVNFFNGQRQLTGNSIEYSDQAALLPIVPIYKQSGTNGVSTDLILKCQQEMLSRLGKFSKPLYLPKYGDLSYDKVYRSLHLPESMAEHDQAVDTLAFYELLHMQIAILDSKKNAKDNKGIALKRGVSDLQQRALKDLPFTLTGEQAKAVEHMNEVMAEDKPSATMLVADVGAGKTIVSQLACLRAAETGYQSILVAPTEVLAQQLFDSFKRVVANFEEEVNVQFLSGSMKARERNKILKGLRDGSIDILVGTHAVLSKSVEFKNLGFVCYDEQQKFGANQRTEVLKSRTDGKTPHLFMQSATPIPRSLAQSIYGDMDILTIDEKPAGRIPIETKWIKEDPDEFISQSFSHEWNDILTELNKGNQAFIVTPMVNESDKADAASVKESYSRLKKGVLASYSMEMVHGQMKKDDVRAVMERFRNKEISVIIASTVVEVGVDIPDATRMVILSADRLGASSLHQIRGRIGRNDKKSVCYLVSNHQSESSHRRLQALVDYTDGFKVAEVDLQTRSEGSIFGTNQSGDNNMRFASVLKNSDMIPKAREDAERILNSPMRIKALEVTKNLFDDGDRRV